jgi:hypothetical protein
MGCLNLLKKNLNSLIILPFFVMMLPGAAQFSEQPIKSDYLGPTEKVSDFEKVLKIAMSFVTTFRLENRMPSRPI